MGIIQILDHQLANQIAAGEVVERPASVVKELVENAIDAEATKILIRIQEGGISSIQVSDNGAGMQPDDAVLAFARHATSKLRKPRDLFAIRTLGFRGEALPSIASVSRMTLTTAHSADELGVRVRVAGGDQQEVESVSRTRGTDVLVEDLFFNTPARLKYLKTVNTEISHITDIIGRMALSHPQISFILSHQNRELIRTAGDNKLKHVMHAIYGRQVASKLLPIMGENLDFSIQGYIAKPEITRASRSYITLILNGRYVRSIPLTQTILRAYGTLLPVGRFPIGVLQLQMDPKLTDVNVHPTKLEVRLSKERECAELITQSIKQAFRDRVLIPRAPVKTESKQPKPVQETLRFSGNATTKKPVVKESAAPFFTDHSAQIAPPVEIAPISSSPSISDDEKPTFVEESHSVHANTKINEADKVTTGTIDEREHNQRIDEQDQHSLPDEQPDMETFPDLTPLSQIHGTYLVAQSADGFYLIDQHAAHERIYYEIFYHKLGKDPQQQQLLLMPMTIEVTAAEAKQLQPYLAQLKEWGLSIEPFGGTTFLVQAYPSWFPEESAKDLIDEVIAWINEHGQVDTAMFRDATAKMMSCKAAIKANRHLRQDEMDQLLEQLRTCDNPYTCPHGRPILVHFSTYELEKMFKRVM